MSEAIDKFNGLNGTVATREELQEIVEVAKDENAIDVIFRCSKVLNENEDSKFLIEIEPSPTTGLKAPRHVGSYKEALDNCGRLRKGFKFENGLVIKVEKPVKKNAQTPKKPTNKTVKISAKSKKSITKTSRNTPKVAIEKVIEKPIVPKVVPVEAKIIVALKSSYKNTLFSILRKPSTKVKNKVVFYPVINDKRISTTNFARKYDAVKLVKEYIDWLLKKKEAEKKILKVDKNGQIGLFGTAKDKETIAFNKSILKAKRNGFKTTQIFQLGKAKSEFKKIVGDTKILLSGSVLKKAMNKDKDHSLQWENFINMPDYINNPIAVFKSETVKNGLVVLTEVKNNLEKPVLAAFHLNEHIKINDIRSIYSKTNISIYKKWYKKGLLIFGNKESDLFKLIATPIVTKFKKPLSENKVTKKNISTKKSDEKGLKEPGETKPKKHAKISKIALAGNDQESEFYTVAGEVGKFLQQVERKPFESVVITLDGQQGAGKTTTLYKFMDSFAITGNKCLFLSLEEHPASSLAKDKVSKYLSTEAQENIDTVGEVENIAELYDFVKDYEIIFIDSWQKLLRMVGAIRLDEDLRKKFNGKVFVAIFQQTTTGRTKGGAEVVFDGDIIIKMVKESSFADNYAYFDKNRYTLIAIEDIRYNIASGTTYNPNAKEEPATELQPVEEVKFNFIVK